MTTTKQLKKRIEALEEQMKPDIIERFDVLFPDGSKAFNRSITRTCKQGYTFGVIG